MDNHCKTKGENAKEFNVLIYVFIVLAIEGAFIQIVRSIIEYLIAINKLGIISAILYALEITMLLGILFIKKWGVPGFVITKILGTALIICLTHLTLTSFRCIAEVGMLFIPCLILCLCLFLKKNGQNGWKIIYSTQANDMEEPNNNI